MENRREKKLGIFRIKSGVPGKEKKNRKIGEFIKNNIRNLLELKDSPLLTESTKC